MRRTVTSLLALIAMIFSGYSQEKYIAEEIAAIVGNSPIMLSDVESTAQRILADRKRNGQKTDQLPKEEAFEMLMLQKLLASQAMMDSLDKGMKPNDARVEEEVAKMIEAAGSVKALEKQKGKPIFQIKKDLQKDVREMELSQMMEQNVRNKVTITHNEVLEFFNSIPSDSLGMVPVQYTYAQIVKMPPSTDNRKYQIREKLLEYRQRILDGEKFAVLARLYSDDKGSAIRGGDLDPLPLEGFVAPFAEAVQMLEVGQVSEIVETEFGFHIIQLISKSGSQYHCRHILLKPKFTVEETQRVTAQLDSLVTEIRKNSITFEQAALVYSEDKDTRMNGGTVFNIAAYYNTGDLRQTSSRFVAEEIPPADYMIIRNMKVGDISESFETTDANKGNTVYKVIKLTHILPAHNANIEDDFEILETVALMNKQGKVIDEWIDKTIDKTFIYITPEYKAFKMEKPWVERAEVVEKTAIK